MADVRLTATNPEDSSVVPVACDASGRLLLQELPAIDTIDGDLTVTGKGSFAGGKSIIGNDGSAQFAQGAVDIYANGTVEFTQNVNFDGSATFAGSLTINEPTQNGSGNGAYIGPGTEAGNLTLYAEDTSSGGGRSQSFLLGYSGGSSKTLKVDIGHDGSAEFAGGKAGFTAEGYLWCTTRRGDTVILDATSNGLGSWEEYSPTTRIDDIRDKLNAKGPDTGEMPADTP